MVVQNTVRPSDPQRRKREEICLQAIEILKGAPGRTSAVIPEIRKLVATVGLVVVVTKGKDAIREYPVKNLYIQTCRTDPDHVHVQIRKSTDTVEYSRGYGAFDKRRARPGKKSDTRRNRACVRRRQARRSAQQGYREEVRLYNSSR